MEVSADVITSRIELVVSPYNVRNYGQAHICGPSRC